VSIAELATTNHGWLLTLETIAIGACAALACPASGWGVTAILAALLGVALAGAAVLLAALRESGRRWREAVDGLKAAEIERGKLAVAVEQSNAVVMVTDAEGRIEQVNPRFAEVTGYAPEEVFGQKPYFLKSGKLRSSHYEGLWETIKAGQVWRGDFHNKRKNGEEYWESAVVAPVADSTGKITHFVAVKEDISERRQTLEELERAKEAAEIAMRVQNEFLSTISHEVRTPMNSIMGFTEALDARIQEPELKGYLGNITSAARELLDLLTGILDLAKAEAGKIKLHLVAVDPASIIKEVEVYFGRAAAAKGLKLEVALPPSLPGGMMLDAARLKQVIFNLVDNAVKFTDAGGVRVLVGCRGSDQLAELVVAVEDSGAGVAPGQAKEIFKPFVRLPGRSNAKYGGAGVGLALCARLASLMGGAVTFAARPGGGSVFTLTLPEVRVTAPPRRPDKAATGVSSRFKESLVLVADDSFQNRGLIKALARDPRLKFIEAVNGNEALRLAHLRNPDLILMDIQMPELDGNAAARRLKADPETSGIPIVAVTASSEKAELDDPDELFVGVLVKPFTSEVLLEEFRKHLPCEPTASHGRPPSWQAAAMELSPQALAALPPLVASLETSLAEEWREINELFALDEVVAFARKVAALAERHGCAQLRQWAEKAVVEAESFSMDELAKTFNDFPDVTRLLKEACRGGPGNGL